MPCHRIGKRDWLCMGNEPVEIRHENRRYWFEWTAASGWIACNEDGSERLSPVPKAVWDKVDQLGRGRAAEAARGVK